MGTLEIGNSINGRYGILAPLGAGGMATVYRVFDSERKIELALKLLNHDQLILARRRDRFLREYSILSKLNHPTIVRVYDQGESEAGVPFFTMELARGRDLATKIGDTGDSASIFPAPEVLTLLEEVAQGLKFIHAHGILYCDLKPANIILLETDIGKGATTPKIKFVDFGIARIMGAERTEDDQRVVGSSSYMSPEQIRGENLDVRSDIYSFGALTFELLIGKVPFAGDSSVKVHMSHLIGPAPSAGDLRQDVPPAIDKMIRICMAKEPGDRFASMDDILVRLSASVSRGSQPSLVGRVGKALSNLLTKG